VGGFYGGVAVAAEERFEVIDADEEDVRPRRVGGAGRGEGVGEECGEAEEEQAHEGAEWEVRSEK
jgi:hypothetical protein